MEGNVQKSTKMENITKSEIYEQKVFKDEFEALLTKLNNAKLDESGDMATLIDLDFLKNDYIELYDLRKLLNEPKYHLAKFRILFLDFINLKDFFYKTIDNNELINNEKSKSKGATNSSDKLNSDNSGNKIKDTENKNKPKKSYKKGKAQKNNYNNDKLEIITEININIISSSRKGIIGLAQNKFDKSNDEIQNNGINEDEQIQDNNISGTIDLIKKNENNKNDLGTNIDINESTGKVQNKEINIINTGQNINISGLNNEAQYKIEQAQNINIIGSISVKQKNEISNNVSEQNIIINELSGEDQNQSNSQDINNKQDSFTKSINKKNISKENASSESSQNKLEISQNESILNLALTDMKQYNKKDKMRQFKFKFLKKELGIDENEKMSGMSYEDFARKSFKIMLMMVNQNNNNFENPKNVKISDLIEMYLSNINKNVQTQKKNKNFKIETNLHDIMLTKLIDYNMEIDIVVEIEINDIYKLIKMFPKNVFFIEDFRSYNSKGNDRIT